MHSSLCSTAMYMSCTLSIMLFMGFSSPTSRLFLTATEVTDGKRRARPAMMSMGIRRVERSRLEPVSLYCDEPGSFKTVAKDMDDLAGLMDDIGLENLCRQLDLEPKDCTPF